MSDEAWKEVLKAQFQAPYFQNLQEILENSSKNSNIFPPSNLIFNAFNLCPFDEVKVVLLGQDPYHKKGQAMGLSFSVPDGVRIPPSLRNIYKEIKANLDITEPNSGDLTSWAKQGILLMNAFLSVKEATPNSHSKIGWEIFTDEVIKILSEKKENLVFMLWGNFAKSKAKLIDENKHLILQAAHPSPLARTGFAGCKHFSKCNEYLIKHNKIPIDWDLNSKN